MLPDNQVYVLCKVENWQLHELRQRLREKTRSTYSRFGVASLPSSPRKKTREEKEEEAAKALVAKGKIMCTAEYFFCDKSNTATAS